MITVPRNRAVKRVAIAGIIGNIFLLVIKIWVGLISKSQAMIADGMNSAGDVFASLMTYIGNHIASQPDDDDHPYGHGKAEYLFSMIISFSLILVAITIFKSAFDSFINKQVVIYSYWLIIVAAITIVLKLILYVFAKNIGKKYNSLLAFANAEDHRNDVFITSLTLASVVTTYYNLYVVDAIAGMLIALWIAYTGATIFASSYNVLMDTALASDVLAKMREDIKATARVDHLDALVAKPVGLNYLLIVKVSIDGDLSVAKGHMVSADIKAKLMDYELVDDVVVHTNPTQEHPEKEYLK